MSDDAIEPVNWQEFFDEHAPHYMQNSFVAWTTTEVSFIEQLFELSAGASILDIGCGTGRHSVEFARRGYRVTGIDLSSGMLAQARAHAENAGVEVEFIHQDATQGLPGGPYDVAVCLCEGGIGLADQFMDPVAHDLAILKNAFGVLKPGGHFLITAMNGYATVRKMQDTDVANGSFDPATMVATYCDELELPEGRRTIAIRERILIPPEMVSMLRYVGFEVLHAWGGTAGEWGERPVKLDEIEAMYVCRKPQ